MHAVSDPFWSSPALLSCSTTVDVYFSLIYSLPSVASLYLKHCCYWSEHLGWQYLGQGFPHPNTWVLVLGPKPERGPLQSLMGVCGPLRSSLCHYISTAQQQKSFLTALFDAACIVKTNGT